MKTTTVLFSNRRLRFGLIGLLAVAALFGAMPVARAGLTFELHIYRNNQGQNYNFFTPLYANSTPPDAQLGTYVISSPGWPASGSRRGFEMTAGGLIDRSEFDSEHGYGDFDSLMQQITNGDWTILFTNATTTNIFTFTVSAPDMTSNMLPATVITYPPDGALDIENLPAFTWQGPSDWPVSGGAYVYNYDSSFYQSGNLPAAQNIWTIPASIPNGMNCTFRLQYITNNETPVFTTTPPLDTNSQPVSGWLSTSVIETGGSVSFAVTNPPVVSPVLIAHYTFDDGGNLGQDSSGNGYDLDFNGGDGVSSSGTAVGGGGAAYFDGGSFFSYTTTPGSVLNALAGDFTISFWINTTQDDGNEDGPAWAGAGIVAADIPFQYYDLIPAALDGGEIGFNTGGSDEETLNSSATDVNDGNYHHVVITRNQTTGEKRIYIDGVLDNSDFATMNPLSDPRMVAVGCAIDASQSDPNNANPGQYFQGLLDDLQIYSGVLSAGDVANLYANPGSTVGGFGGGHRNVAHYTFDDSGNLGRDSSGNGNDMTGETYWGPQHQFNNDAVAGGGAIQFFGTDAINPDGQALANLNGVLAGSFTFSAWVKTTVTNGADYNNAFFGAVMFWAYNDHSNTNDTIPLSITGSKAAFTTRGGDSGASDTLHSSTSVNDGNYHLITVTRDAATGEKKIYVDGNLETSQTGTTNPLNGNNYYLTIGGRAYILESDSTVTNYSSYNGLLDDLQIYSGVLSDAEVASLYANPGTTVPDVAGGSGGPKVHYDFDEGTVLAADVSGNNNNIVHAGNFGGSGPSISSDAAAGSGSVSFDGGSYLTASPNLLATLAGDFTVSLWLKTSQSFGDQNDFAWEGAGVIAADSPNGGSKDLIPVALTGGQVAFNVGDGNSDDTLNSSATVNDDNWHHVVVTRNQSTGERQIYIDGTLDSSDIASTALLNSPLLLTIGAKSDASDSDPASPDYNGSNGFEGLLDDVQIYNRVLSSEEVTYLYDHPGAVIAGSAGSDFATALNTTNLTWTSGGDLPWFTETVTTHDGLAAQSGPITDSQSSYLQTTVPADGQVSFYWKVSSEENYDYLTFYINGNEQDAISGEVDWNQETYSVSAGDVLRWEYSKDGSDSDGLDAGFLDEVNFTATPPDTNTVPVITLNPFSQTNSPGYNVALLAGASGSPDPTLQWFKVGYGAISGATNALFIPTNSGNAGIAGNYYAAASNIAGSANTTTAAVSFVSAPPPPDWSVAFKSPFQAQDPSLVTKDYYYGAVLDVGNNIYTAAEFSGNVTVGSTNLESGSGSAAAIVKQTATGSPLWVAAITNNGNASAFGACVAPAPGGGVYLLGDFNGTNWLGTNQFTDAGGGDIFLARFDASGSNVWIKTVGSTNGDFTVVNALASDPSGNVTFSCLLGSGPVTIGGSNYDIAGQEGVLVQFDPTGAVRWSQLLPDELAQYLAYSAGRIYVSLSTSTAGGTSIIIGGVTNATDRSWGLACLNATDGQAVWVRGVGAQSGSGQGNPYATGAIDDVPRIAVSGTNLFITGVAYDTSAAFGSFTVNFAEPRGQYFARYDTNGSAQLATAYGSTTTTPIAAVADASGNVYVSGDFDTYAFFGTNIIAAPDNRRPYVGSFSQAFLAKFDRNGNPLWARAAVAPATVNFLGIALAPDGVWASGYCISTNTATGYTPTWFGTNFAYGDTQAIVTGSGIGATVTFTGYPGGVLAKITDVSTVISPVTLLNPKNTGTNFQFQFLSQSGVIHAVQYRTNLATGNWLTYSNVAGDGNLQIIPIPLSVFAPSAQGFVRLTNSIAP